MPVAAVDPVLGSLAVAGAAEQVDVGVHEQLGCHLHHLGQQVASSVGLQVLAHELCRAHRVGDFHRIFSFAFFGRNLKIDAVVVASGGSSDRATPRTPLWWTQLHIFEDPDTVQSSRISRRSSTSSRDLSARGCQGKVAGTQCRWMIDLYRRCGEKVSTMTKSGQTEGGSRDASLGVCHLCGWTGPVTRINWRQRKYLKVRRLTRNICSECMELLVNGTSRHKKSHVLQGQSPSICERQRRGLACR